MGRKCLLISLLQLSTAATSTKRSLARVSGIAEHYTLSFMDSPVLHEIELEVEARFLLHRGSGSEVPQVVGR